ncbi:MAG: hypothetical protein AAGC68_04900 [Verrucomicrobiota bacterium]
MSDPSSESEQPESDAPESNAPESDLHLESLLKKLEPNPLEVGLRDSLVRQFRFQRASTEYDPHRPRWRQVIPLTLAGIVAMAAYASYRLNPESTGAEEATPAVASEISPTPASSGAPLFPDVSASESFLPVSAQGFLIETSSEGIVETDEGPQEKMSLEFRDAYHWHDPETGTNLRFFQPRSEEVMIPLRTD